MANKVVRRKAAAKPQQGVNVIPIVFIAFGILFVLSIWTPWCGLFGKWMLNIFTGLFGSAAYITPLCLLAGGAAALFMQKLKKLRTSMILLLPFICSVILHLIYRIGNDKISGGINGAYLAGQSGFSGGVFGAAGEGLFILFGGLGSFVIAFALLAIMIVVIFQFSVITGIKKVLLGFKTIALDIKEGMFTASEYDEEVSAPASKPKKEKKKREEQPPEHQLEDYNWKDNIVIKDTNSELEQAAEKPMPEPKPEKHKEKTTEPAEVPNEEPTETESVKINDDGEIVDEHLYDNYKMPETPLLSEAPKVHTGGNLAQLKESAAKLVDILESFGIQARITNITRGSSVTRYEVLPAEGIKVNKITALDRDIALRLPASNVRIEVLPGCIGIEVSNDTVTTVYMRTMLETPEFKNHPSKLAVAVGRDINGNTVVMDIAKTPHLLIAGATGSGKSVCINTIITSILYKAKPDEVKLVMVDPKVVELGSYNGIPHLLIPVVTDPKKAAGALCWAVKEMEERYLKFADHMVRDLKGYNKKMRDEGGTVLPQIVIIIDELADLMMVAPGEVQDYICRIAQKARAAGMHLVVATQRPSVDVITGVIKANIPSRISFAVSSSTDSRTILDTGGAEKLVGKGDMLMMLAGSSNPNRVQGAFVSDTDVENIVNYIKSQTAAAYNDDIMSEIEGSSAPVPAVEDADSDDALFTEAAEIAFELGQVSASMLQRRLKVGYARAGRLIDMLDKRNVISTYDGSNKPRTLTMTRQQFDEMMEKQNGK